MLIDFIFRLIFIIQHTIEKRFFTNFSQLVTYSSADKEHTFFGYYDVSPFSFHDRFILAHATSIVNKTPKSTDTLDIGFFDLNSANKFHIVGKTLTWNWQQGCRLQWFPYNNESKIIYNSIVKENYGSIVKDINTKETLKRYDFPIYSISSNGQYAVSLNFSRLAWCRPGYGYSNTKDSTSKEKEPEEDGVYICDLNINSKKLILTVKQIANIKRLDSMNKAIHYFNHLSFSPSNKRFLFLHLWINKNKRYSRLITSDLNGSKINIINNTGFTSHYCWLNKNEILSFSKENDFGNNYYIYNDFNGDKKLFANGIINHDSHPSLSMEGYKLLYDCYPNRFKRQNLYIYNNDVKSLKKIKSFYNPLGFKGENRCDLHPRWNYNSNMICCDSPNLNQFRKIYVLKGIK